MGLACFKASVGHVLLGVFSSNLMTFSHSLGAIFAPLSHPSEDPTGQVDVILFSPLCRPSEDPIGQVNAIPQTMEALLISVVTFISVLQTAQSHLIYFMDR